MHRSGSRHPLLPLLSPERFLLQTILWECWRTICHRVSRVDQLYDRVFAYTEMYSRLYQQFWWVCSHCTARSRNFSADWRESTWIQSGNGGWTRNTFWAIQGKHSRSVLQVRNLNWYCFRCIVHICQRAIPRISSQDAYLCTPFHRRCFVYRGWWWKVGSLYSVRFLPALCNVILIVRFSLVCSFNRQGKGESASYHFVGFCTAYPHFFWPECTRFRIRQVV